MSAIRSSGESAPALGEGDYKTEAILYDKAGAVLVAQDVAFSKLDEKKKFPWYGNALGMTDEAFFPFTAMTVKGNTVSCWGRCTCRWR